MRSGEVTLSHGEIDRLAVVQALEGGRLKQADAAWQLGLSIRQVKRLLWQVSGVRSRFVTRNPSMDAVHRCRQENGVTAWRT
jgi:hypothetical protein